MDQELIPEKKDISKKEKKSKKSKEKQLLTVSDTCKNCGTPLALDQLFCSHCGAKRMYNRLNWSNLTEDFVDRFLNIENNFLRTFIDLFKAPQDVIGGYIDGTRKRYLSAFSYFAISLTIVGFYTFVFRNWFMDDEILKQGMVIPGTPQDNIDINSTKQMLDWVFDYQSILTFINIPLYAIVSKLVFWNYKKYNFIEHVVIYLYVYSHTQIIASVVGALFLWSSIAQMLISSLLMFVYIGYTAYVLMKLFGLTIEKIVLKTLLFFVIFGVVSVVIFGVGGWILYKLGLFDVFIEKLKEQGEIQRSIKESATTVKDSLGIDSVKQGVQKVKDTILFLGAY